MGRPIALWCGILVLVCATSAAGQTYQGGIRGQVRDPQGVIPGAEIILIGEQTNATRTAVTNDVGEYAFANVLPATYTLKVSIAGFKTEERKGLRSARSSSSSWTSRWKSAPLRSRLRSPASRRSSKARTRPWPPPSTRRCSKASRSSAATRSISAISTPDVIQTGDPQFVRYQDQSGASFLSLGGGPRRGNGYLIEGVSITDFTNRPTIVPSIEAVEELKVQIKTYDADMGHAAGGVFNTTARSGSNRWHGSALFLSKPGLRRRATLFFAKRAGLDETAAVLLQLGRLARRTDRQGQDVLLVQHGRLPADAARATTC